MLHFSNIGLNPTILSFLKVPRAGYVKTRLAKSIGSEPALYVYRTLVERQLERLPKNYPVEIHFTPDDAIDEMRQWLRDNYEFYPQCAGELGQRLEHAVRDAFARKSQSAICIGGDCPGLNSVHFEQTAAALQSDYDVVFGPSEDGGYYLVGLNAPYVELFQKIPWSTSTTLDVSLKRAAELKLRVKQLETLYDIDGIVDLRRAISQRLLPSELNPE